MRGTGSGERRGWLRAAGLLLATAALSVGGSALLVAIPLALLVLFATPRRGVAVAVGLSAVALTFPGGPASGVWFFERAWGLILGGWFVALSLRWPGTGFVPRGLGAVAGAFAVMGAHFWARSGDWAVVDWAVTDRMREVAGAALHGLRASVGPEVVSQSLEAMVLETVAFRGAVFPALLGLASLSALGLAWWLHGRLARGTSEAIGPLRDFRFNDQMVWVLILGLVVLLGAWGGLERLGTNAVVFMGGLYALRGAAVVLFLTGGVSLLGGLLLVMTLLLVAPLLLAGAFVIGLGDTWLNLRARRGVPNPS